MKSIQLIGDSRGYVTDFLGDLLNCGWSLENIPADGKIPRNGLKVVLRSEASELRLRVYIYKVTQSGRSKPHERRVEITTTYQGGLDALSGFSDIVLGMDSQTGRYVGIDNRRMQLGGPTHNASSFFDLEGLSVKKGELLVNPRAVANSAFPTGIEQHAFFDRSRLSEYLFNRREIHSGVYAFAGPFCGALPSKNRRFPPRVSLLKAADDKFVLSSKISGRQEPLDPALVEAIERGDFNKPKKGKISPEQLKKIQAFCEEIGALGEQVVLAAERARLRKLGHNGPASRVERVSLRSIGEGYDILSFEDDGATKRYLEVKSTIGAGMIIDISRGEWRAAKALGRKYYLVRVTSIMGKPRIFYARDPAKSEKDGLISKTATGWKIDLAPLIHSRK